MRIPFQTLDVWPEGWDPLRPPRLASPFSANYSDTMVILDRELTMLQAREPRMQVDASGGGIRKDGELAANASVRYPGVIVAFQTTKLGALSYPCNRFRRWQDNVRAVALGLEALRKVERYGIAERGQQYAGFAQIGSGTAMGSSLDHLMTIDEAARIVAEGACQTGARWTASDLFLKNGAVDFDEVQRGYRQASKVLHPDAGGDPEVFKKLTEARDLLLKKVSA